MTSTDAVRIAVVIPGDPRNPPDPASTRWAPVFDALRLAGAAARAIIYRDDVGREFVAQLAGFDGALVWINPIVDGHRRDSLDLMLREVVTRGVFVSADPRVIQRMGTKDVLYDTRTHPWGTDTRLHRSWQEMQPEVRDALERGARVLKQRRGQDGNGVWRIALVDPGDGAADPIVYLQEARSGSAARATAAVRSARPLS